MLSAITPASNAQLSNITPVNLEESMVRNDQQLKFHEQELATAREAIDQAHRKEREAKNSEMECIRVRIRER